MSRSIAASLILVLTLSGCGAVRDSRINPFNWFGGDRAAAPAATEEPEEVNPLIPRERQGLFSRARADRDEYKGQPVDVIKNLTIERTQNGAIIRATGVARFINTYDVRLQAENDGVPVDGVLNLTLESVAPPRPISSGTERQREVIAAVSVTAQDLEGVNVIRVAGTQNAQSARR